jgi:multiple sugar transport system substrate-binding protein
MNALMPLDDLVKRDNIDLSVYYQQGIQENTYNGNLYGLPWGTAALYMLINLDVMEEAGLELPPMDWTIEDFTTLVEAFADKEDLYGYAIELTSMSGLFPFIWANGGDLFNADRSEFAMNQPEAVQALQYMADLYQRNLLPQDSVSADGDTLDRWFINNRVAMRIGAASSILSLQKAGNVRFEAWPMPGGKVKNTTVFKSNIVGLSADTDITEEAWTLLKFLRGPEGEGESLYMKAKRMPPCIDDQKYWTLYADPQKYPKMIENNSRKIAESYGHNLPIRPGWLEIEQLVTPAYQQMFLGEATAQEAMDEIAPKIQAVMDRSSK